MILGTSRSVRVYAYPEPVDLRNGYDGLFGLVKQGLGRDPLSGDLFLFVNARRKGCKVLVWDGTGLCIFQKRLERSRFAALWRDDKETLTGLGLFASLTRSPRRQNPIVPALMPMAPTMTCLGVEVFWVVLSPSCPTSLRPNAQIEPSDFSTSE